MTIEQLLQDPYAVLALALVGGMFIGLVCGVAKMVEPVVKR